MFNIISIIIIIIAALAILIIIIKKFPVLAILNVANIPGEKEAEFKHKIIKARVERDLSRWSGFFGRIYLFIYKHWLAFLHSQRSSLEKVKTSYNANIKIPWQERQKRIKKLSLAAQESLQQEDDSLAEKKLVEIISLDKKNLEAFFRLGELYAEQKKWSEARQTYNYALKLIKGTNSEEVSPTISLQEIYFALANLEKNAENLTVSLENIREALELEPNSPRYLDLILDLSIMMKEKVIAQEFWDRLEKVNPENNKLVQWRERIKKL